MKPQINGPNVLPPATRVRSSLMQKIQVLDHVLAMILVHAVLVSLCRLKNQATVRVRRVPFLATSSRNNVMQHLAQHSGPLLIHLSSTPDRNKAKG